MSTSQPETRGWQKLHWPQSTTLSLAAGKMDTIHASIGWTPFLTTQYVAPVPKKLPADHLHSRTSHLKRPRGGSLGCRDNLSDPSLTYLLVLLVIPLFCCSCCYCFLAPPFNPSQHQTQPQALLVSFLDNNATLHPLPRRERTCSTDIVSCLSRRGTLQG